MLYRLLKWLGQVVLVLFFDYRSYNVRNVPETGPVILASNHQSYMDPVLVGSAPVRPVNFIARGSLFENRLFGGFLGLLNSFPVQRGGSDIKAMREGLRRLDRGEPLVVFPEGTRTEDGSIRPLELGLAVLAARSKAPVIPVAVDGAFECWPRHRKLPRPGKVRVAYGRPLRYQGHGSEQAREFVTELRTRILRLQQGLRSGDIQAGRMTG